MRVNRPVLLALALVAAIATGVVAPAALSSTSSATLDTTYNVGDEINVSGGPTVNFSDGYTTTVDNPKQPPDTIDLSPGAVFESQAETFARVSQWDDDYLKLADLNASNAMLNVSRQDKNISFEGEAISVAFRNYGVDDGLADIKYQKAIGKSLTVTFRDLPTNITVKLDTSTSQNLPTKDTGTDGEARFSISKSGDYELTEVTRDDIYANERPDDGTIVQNQTKVDLQIDVDDPEQYGLTAFSKDVRFYNATSGALIGTDQIKREGTANVTWSNVQLGTNRWYAELDGGLKSDTYSFGTPNTLTVREERTQEVINDSDIKVTVRFFRNQTQAIQRIATNGTVDMSGLPTGQRYIAEGEAVADNQSWESRRVFIPEVTEPTDLYLLNTTDGVETVDLDFVLDDRTGDFGSQDTRLLVRKPMNVSYDPQTNETTIEYRQIIGDEFGADDRLSTTLEKDVRYQLVLRNDQGQTRQLGNVVAERDELIELTVGQVDYNLTRTNRGVDWDAKLLERDNGNEYIRVALNVPNGPPIEDVNIKIFASEDPANKTLRNQTVPGESREIVVTQTIPSEYDNVSSWTVEWTATRDNETITAKTVVGSGSYPVDSPLPTEALSVFSALLIVFVGGFFSVRVSALGTIIVPLVALGLFAIGWLPLPLSWVLAALTLGVGTEFAARGGFERR